MESVPRVRIVLIGLVAATVVSLALTLPTFIEEFGARRIAALAAAIGFAKAHFVAAEFMELRHRPQILRWFDIWLAVVGVASVALILR